MKNSFLKRILVFITVSSIIAQSFSPYVAILSQRAYAQEVIDQSTTTETQTTTVEQTTPAPESTTPTPSQEQVVPTDEVTPTPTDTPTEVTPTPTDTPTEVTPTEVNNNSPPSENTNTSETQGIDTSFTPTETPVTLTPTQTGLTTATENTKDEQLNLILLNNVSAPSIDLEAVESEGSAVLTTDKPDYAPTDTALITGSNLLSNTAYTLRIWSDNQPPTGVSVEVTSDENGVFAYAYQLDGTYRPNYSAELRDLSGNIVATVTFTDSPVSGCTSDSAGANDEPGQKDLTKLCVDYSNVPTNLGVSWNWDDIGWSGNNTGDACSLFDTDNDGNANYALCVVVENTPATYQSKVLYSCGDGRPDRCTSPVVVLAPSVNTSCNASVVNTDPFPAGDAFPNDTEASCNISMSDVGGGSAFLLDVCSYPSQQPNSDPSDCIVIQDNKGTIQVFKNVVPDDPTTNWVITGTGPTGFNETITGDGSTSIKSVDLGTYSITETAGANTNLSDYITSWSCTKNGVAYLSGSGTTASNIVLGKSGNTPDSVVCTFTNTLSTATITVNKTLSPSNDPGLFNLQIDGQTAGTGANVGNNGTTGSVTVNTTGTHTVSETAGTNTSLSDYTTTWVCNNNTSGNGTSAGPFSLTANQNLDCTFTNTRNTGSVLVNKLVDTNGDGTYEGGNTEANNLGFSWSLDTLGTNNFGTTVSNVNTGSHSVNENLNSQPYHFVGWYLTSDTSKTCANTTNTTLPANISVTSGQTTAITLCNARNTGTVMVHKDVQGPNGENIVDTSNNFTVQLDGSGSQSITDDGTVTYNNVPTGNHTVTESLVAPGYTLYGISETQGAIGTPAGLSISVSSGATTHVYVTNRQESATITVEKEVLDASGQTVSDHHTFTVQLNGANDDNSLADNHNVAYVVNPGGPYTISEISDSDYDNLGCKLASGAAATGFNVLPGEEVTVTCTNQQKPGSISGYKYESNGTTPIANWGIKLFTCTTSDFLTCVQSATTTTNGSGFYSFINLVAGFYKVVEDLVDGFTPVGVTSHNVTINPNTQSEDNNFSNFKNINITVCKEDTNQNRIAGWEMTLNVDNVASGSAKQTDGNGCYTFTNLGPNHSYSVTEEDRNGWSPVSDPSFTHDFGQPVDGQNINYTFVNVQLGSIIVKKVMVGGTESFGFTGDVAGTISVNNGTLSTNDVLPGTYTSIEGTEAGWDLTDISCNDTTNGGTASTGNETTRTATFNVEAGETITCTFTNTKLGNVVVIKYNDLNGDGNKDDGESVLNSWEIHLDSMSQFTGNGDPAVAGQVTFSDLSPDTYTLSEQIKEGWDQTNIACGDEQGIDKDNSHEVVLGAGQTVTCYIGNQGQGTIIVEKDVVGTSTDEEFNFTISDGNELIETIGFTLSDGESTNPNYSNLSANTYVVSEEINGLYNTSSSCVSSLDDEETAQAVELDPGETVTCTFTNTRKTGTLQVLKNVDLNADGDYTDENETGATDWVWQANGGSNHNTGDSAITVDTGDYALTETPKNDFHFVSLACDGGSLNTQTNTVTVTEDANVVCTFTNARDTGTIEIVKNTIGGDNTFGFTIEGLTSSSPSITTTDGTGTTGSLTVAAGTYSVSETDIPNGWSIDSLTCEKNNEQSVVSSEFNVSDGDSIICTATNKRDTGRILIKKLIDEDGDIETTEDRSAGENWEFEINGTSDDTSNPSVLPTDSNGETSSGDINTGEYTIKETIKEGYRILSASCEERQAEEFSENGAVTQGEFNGNDSITGINVFLDATVVCEFINTLTLPKLVISKSNDAVGNKSPNETVGFTITIAAEETGGAADNVKVVDLLPKGFIFNSSSWKVVSSDISRGDNGDITSLLSAPTYASPGTWNLKHLNSGETLTLTYTATIDGAQQTGTYYDNAWGQGNPVGGTDVIFANADIGDLDPGTDPSEFVGTQVSIVNPNQPGVDYKTTSTREVLGASTYLPATGENTLWVIIATLLFGLGLGTTLAGIKLRKKYE